ncbi:uncharacterized protein LOC143286657 [Babylonia areolata]|uniref:uncharacterized protein LOC143286657 n=1 Tax=Babylonia areolata TaxID=304850 RepID=UPI003FD0FF2D
MSVVWPHRVNLLCTRRKVIGLLGGIATFFAAVYSHYLYGYRLVYYEQYGDHFCVMESGTYLAFIEEVFTYVDLMLYSVLPFTCLLIANSVLIWKLRASVRETRQKFTQGHNSEQTEARQKMTQSVTLTVIFVSVAFIILTLPSALFHIIYYVAALMRSTSVYDRAEATLINAVTFSLMFTNNAVNFYLYCLTGRRFREEFLSVICCRSVATSSPGRALPVSEQNSSERSSRR